MNCINCNCEVDRNYCPQCGQASQLDRIDGHYIVHEIKHVLNFEKGFFYTIRELFIRPGENVRHFIEKDRSRLVKPLMFIIISSLIYSFINHFFHIEDGYIRYEEVNQSTIGIIFKWVQDHYGYANIIMGLFIAFWAKLFFRKYNYNYFEILILLSFVMGIGMLIYSAFAIIQGLFHVTLMQVAGIVGFIYVIWAIGQFFDKRKFSNYVKAFFSYLLGFLTFTFTAILIGTLIDLITKYYT